jgi:dTDP-glucose 4,6-dehydratase
VDAHLEQDPEMRASYPDSPVFTGGRATQLIQHVRDRPGHDRRYAIDFRRARTELGYSPNQDLSAGLRATLEWYVAHTGWWQALLGRTYDAWISGNYARS